MFWKKKKEEESVEYEEGEVDQIMVDEAGALDSGQEEKPRSKNTKIVLIGGIALVLIAAIYFGSQYYNELLKKKDELMVLAGLKKEPQKAPSTLTQKETKKKLKIRKKKLREKKKAVVEEMRREKGKDKKLKEGNIAREITQDVNGAKGSYAPQPEGDKTEKADRIPSETAPPTIEKKVASSENDTPAMTSSGEYAIQIGTYAVKKNAVGLIQKFTERGYETYGLPYSGSSKSYTVYAGPFFSKPEADEAARELRRSRIRSPKVIYEKRNATYKIRIGRYSSSNKSRKMLEVIQDLGFEGSSEYKKGSGKMIVVYIGNFSSRAEAEEVQNRLPKEDVPSSLIVKSRKQG